MLSKWIFGSSSTGAYRGCRDTGTTPADPPRPGRLFRRPGGRVALALLALATQVGATTPSFGKPAECAPSDRALFKRAVEKISSRIFLGQNVDPGALTYDRLLPSAVIGRSFRSFETPDDFLDNNPGCCSRIRPELGFGDDILNPGLISKLLYWGDMLDSDNVIAIRIYLRARVEAEGKSGWFRETYYVLLDRCGRDLPLGRFDVRVSGAAKE